MPFASVAVLQCLIGSTVVHLGGMKHVIAMKHPITVAKVRRSVKTTKSRACCSLMTPVDHCCRVCLQPSDLLRKALLSPSLLPGLSQPETPHCLLVHWHGHSVLHDHWSVLRYLRLPTCTVRKSSLFEALIPLINPDPERPGIPQSSTHNASISTWSTSSLPSSTSSLTS